MKKWKEKRTMGPKNIKWCKCKDQMMVEYRERVRRKYDELDAERGTVEGEWRQYKDAFVGVVEELCGRTSGKGGTPRSRNQGWWTEEVAKAVGGEAGNMEDDRQRGATTHQLKSPVWPEEEGSQEGGGQSTEEYGGRTVPKA